VKDIILNEKKGQKAAWKNTFKQELILLALLQRQKQPSL